MTIEGETHIGDGCTIRLGTRITNSRIGRGVEILDNCVITDSEISEQLHRGPDGAPSRPGENGGKSKVGNFVELKKTNLGRGSKASHLTYLGDATIGEKTNIGAGTITCNYDGKNKHATTIGNNVKIGSNTMLVAPVKVGDGAVTGAGTVVTKDVPPDTLVAGVPAKVKKNLREEENNNSEIKTRVNEEKIRTKIIVARTNLTGRSLKRMKSFARERRNSLPLSKRARIEIYLPEKRKANYRRLQDAF